MSLANRFAALHVSGEPLVLHNVWDAGSARAAVSAGVPAVATGSWSVAAAHGLPDGEALPLDDALANARRIVRAVDAPVSIDFEGGYAVEPEAVAANVARLAGTGAVGCNFEDGVVGGEGSHAADLQSARIAAIRRAVGPDFFLNARLDLFLQTPGVAHDERLVTRRSSAPWPTPPPVRAESSFPVWRKWTWSPASRRRWRRR